MTKLLVILLAAVMVSLVGCQDSGDIDKAVREIVAGQAASATMSEGSEMTIAVEGQPSGHAEGSWLAGSMQLAGALPPVETYTLEDDKETLTVPYYPGLVQLLAKPGTAPQHVAQAVTASGGRVVAQTPAAGVYLAQVAAGKEWALAAKLLKQPWAVTAWPASPVAPGALVAMDFYSLRPRPVDMCYNLHGELVGSIIARSGFPVHAVDITANADSVNIATSLFAEMERGYRTGERTVINLSVQSAASGSAGATDRSNCTSEACKWVQAQQYEFMAQVLTGIQAALKSGEPGMADNTVIVIIAGNAGVEMGGVLKRLQQELPEAARHVKIVGGTKEDGTIRKANNHTKKKNDMMVYARSENVDAGREICSGTSFAAPEVARVLHDLWIRNKNLTSVQLLELFDLVLNDLTDDRVLPMDERGWTREVFLKYAMERVAMTAFKPVKEEPTKQPVIDQGGSNQGGSTGGNQGGGGDRREPVCSYEGPHPNERWVCR